MADTVISVKDARFNLSSKETFFQIKADQKAIMTNSKTSNILNAYNAAFDLWWKNGKVAPKPQRPWILDCDARSMNIIYGMLKGHQYREIEKTYREHHGPDEVFIGRTLVHYGINYYEFLAACGEIDYE